MENLKIKDEQIQRQTETIQSLERKVESLERELQKYLDPDSGEINPSVKYHYKTGEAALLEKIRTLESQLNDCLDTQGATELTRDSERLLEERLDITMTSVFLPTHSWSKTADGDKIVPNYQAWWMFRQLLFDMDIFEYRWSHAEFRYGVDMLNDICQATEDRPTKLKQFDKFELGLRLFGGDDLYHNRKCQAVQSLISSLILIRANMDHKEIKGCISLDEIHEMLVALTIIAQCQRIWTEAKEPEPAEATEAE